LKKEGHLICKFDQVPFPPSMAMISVAKQLVFSNTFLGWVTMFKRQCDCMEFQKGHEMSGLGLEV
jgi:hypothetical protein